VLCEHLLRDDNVCVGEIVRYFEDGATYAWWRRANDLSQFFSIPALSVATSWRSMRI
jgi:hypothetical protein